MKIALFLGAGASVPFDKPTTRQFKEILQKKSRDSNFHNFIFRTLLNVEKFTDIEYVLQAIKEIVDFTDSYGNDYFSSISYVSSFQHQMIAYQNNGYSFVQVVNELKEVYNELKREIFNHYSWKTDEDNNLMTIHAEIFNFLREKSESTRIFTTNYDQAIERYCELRDDIRLVDGFKYDANKQKNIWADGNYTYYDRLDDNITNVYLYKLHGSLNWKEHRSKWIERTSEETITSDPKYPNNMLIYPTLSPKDELEIEPYRSIFNNFKNIMKNSDYCVVIGFSFRII